MIDEAPEWRLQNLLEEWIHSAQRDEENAEFAKDYYASRFEKPHPSDFQTILVQFRALGLIQQSFRTRSVKDTATYWTLTKYGDRVMTWLRAIRKADLDEDDEQDDK